MMKSCPLFDMSAYKDIFGKPGEGVHQYKFMGTSMFDFVASILGAALITYFTKIPLVITTIGVLLVGILLHYIFGVDTSFVKYMAS